MIILENIWIVVLIAFLWLFAKEGFKKAPLGCLAGCILLCYIFIKACTELQEEEKERKEYSRKAQDKLLRELGHDPDSIRLEWLKNKWGSNYIYHMDEL